MAKYCVTYRIKYCKMWQYRKIWQRMVYLNHYNYIVMKKHQFVHISCSPSIYFLVNVPKKDLEEGASWVLGMFVFYSSHIPANPKCTSPVAMLTMLFAEILGAFLGVRVSSRMLQTCLIKLINGIQREPDHCFHQLKSLISLFFFRWEPDQIIVEWA